MIIILFIIILIYLFTSNSKENFDGEIDVEYVHYGKNCDVKDKNTGTTLSHIKKNVMDYLHANIILIQIQLVILPHTVIKIMR